MRYGKKQYFWTLLVVLIVFQLGVSFIIKIAYDSMLDNEKKKALGEHYFICHSIEKDISYLEEKRAMKNPFLKNLLYEYAEYYCNKNITLQFSKNGKMIYSNIEYKNQAEIANIDAVKNRKIVIKELNEERYILVIGRLEGISSEYQLTYCYKLENLTKTWKHMEHVFIVLYLTISLLLAVVLAVLTKKLNQPLVQLTQAVQEIGNGNYEKRVLLKGKDELQQLGQAVNDMAVKINEQIKELDEQMKSKQIFIDNLAHELRTPMTSIYGYADYIQRANLSEEDKYEATSHIMQESKRLSQMAENLLKLATGNIGQVDFQYVDVKLLGEKIKKIFMQRMNEKKETLNVVYNLEQLFGDKVLLESLLKNLVDNALKASDEGKQLTLKFDRDGKQAVIEVIDEGKGISRKELTHIMEPFYRVDKGRSREEGGAGLGLSICHQIALIHNADIEIESEENNGTKVTVKFTTP